MIATFPLYSSTVSWYFLRGEEEKIGHWLTSCSQQRYRVARTGLTVVSIGSSEWASLTCACAGAVIHLGPHRAYGSAQGLNAGWLRQQLSSSALPYFSSWTPSISSISTRRSRSSEERWIFLVSCKEQPELNKIFSGFQPFGYSLPLYLLRR